MGRFEAERSGLKSDLLFLSFSVKDYDLKNLHMLNQRGYNPSAFDLKEGLCSTVGLTFFEQ